MEDTIAKVIELRRAGKSYQDIGAAFGHADSWAYQIVKKNAPELTSRATRLTEATVTDEATPPSRGRNIAGYDLDIPWYHGDGRRWGCGKLMVVTRLLTDAAQRAADDAKVNAHRAACK